MQEVDGIRAVAPVALRLIHATAALYPRQSAEGAEPLADPDRLSAFWRMRIGAFRDEVFEVAYLASGYRLLRDGVDRLEEGTVDRATVYPCRVVEAALKRGAVSLVLAHNHPNGHVQLSEKDKTLNRAIVLAADTAGLRVLDHLIVSPDEVFSFRRAAPL